MRVTHPEALGKCGGTELRSYHSSHTEREGSVRAEPLPLTYFFALGSSAGLMYFTVAGEAPWIWITVSPEAAA